MKMLTEDQLRDLMGKAYMRGRTDQTHHMDAEISQVERIIAGL